MFDLDSWQEIWVTITRNKRRSLLTAFGIFWGIFMLVIMLGAGNGLSEGVASDIQGFSENSALFFTNNTSEPYKGFRKGRYWNMQEEDLDILEAQIKDIKYTVPFLMGQNVTVVYRDKSTSCNTKGNSPLYNQMMPQHMIYGRYINHMDVQDRRKVCVVGRRVYEELFRAGEDPIGTYLKLYNINFQIIGVSEPSVRGVNINGRDDEVISIPYSVMQQIQNSGTIIHLIGVVANENVSMSVLEPQVEALLKARHNIAPTDDFALESINVERIFKQFEMLFTGISVLIWIVGLGTLLAGVVGVSNIIMVTVRERTKEIGVRRAIGAKPASIIFQIIKESTVLTVAAGFLGLAFGVLVLDLADKFLLQNMTGEVFFKNPQINFTVALSAAAIILLCGVLAGILPAYRALQIKAIDAIREEN
ncbi:MAG: ABC transporter permease [Bacteroidales bacterium]|jgi:putative ABC transport system permease protein|nr:ABC transporter permease [Bacteroidales bacterium]OQB68849.1 MAG: Macrolide export ATP-binding/permease protein MacB [Bacteroidetes bacterium ADurb.Bin139]MCZ2317634.1 ABC transporter permease [Bacteroidales bacterium]MDD2330181.1 ABC transporter permease [Bacteroidales bacterium]MDD2771778.1 ABC transporter permease [Bacteroidales bacterium]